MSLKLNFLEQISSLISKCHSCHMFFVQCECDWPSELIFLLFCCYRLGLTSFQTHHVGQERRHTGADKTVWWGFDLWRSRKRSNPLMGGCWVILTFVTLSTICHTQQVVKSSLRSTLCINVMRMKSKWRETEWEKEKFVYQPWVVHVSSHNLSNNWLQQYISSCG